MDLVFERQRLREREGERVAKQIKRRVKSDGKASLVHPG